MGRRKQISKGFQCLEKLLPTPEKQDVFLTALGISCLSQLMLLDPFVFWALRLRGTHGWWGHLLQGQHSAPAHHTGIRNVESGSRQQRQGPNFHDAFWVTCPLISAFLEEKVKRKKKKKKSSAFSLTDGILKYPQKWRRRTSQLLFLPHQYIFQVQNHSFTMYK